MILEGQKETYSEEKMLKFNSNRLFQYFESQWSRIYGKASWHPGIHRERSAIHILWQTGKTSLSDQYNQAAM